MSPDISRVRYERLRCIGRPVYRRQGLLREWGSFVAFLRLTSPEMGPVFEISGTERHHGRRENTKHSCFWCTKSSLFVPRNQSASRPKSNEKDIGIVYRRREEATELLGFHASQGADGGRGRAAEDLGRDGQSRAGKTSRVEGY